MLSESSREVTELYHAALKCPPGQRELLLVNADPEVRRQVERLLAQDPVTTTLPTRPVAGTQLGNYRVEAAIGAGGMGEVYLAVDTRLNRKVALKFLPERSVSDANLKRRFLQEARAASALNHPNIVVLHDIAHGGGLDFLVMEYVPGKTLKESIPAAGLPLEQVVAVGVQVASALAAAHAAGLVHRDIKPANVIVTPEGVAKVLDFGIAKTLNPGDTTSESTSPGMIVGTVAYMSPEQTRGENVDGRSDLFSLGSTLYEAATGRAPFTGASMLALMHAIAASQPPAPSSLRPELPSEFDELLSRCMAKEPGNRPASASELAGQLKSLLTQQGAPRRSSSGRPAVAVVPFLMRTGSEEDRFLSVALADAVIHRLGSSGKLLLRPIASVLRYAGQDMDWTQVARDLNVDMVVDGKIQKVGTKIRVLVHAHGTRNAEDLLSSKFDGEAGDLFELQDRVSEAVCSVLLPTVPRDLPAQAAKPPTNSPVAFETYLRATDRITQLNKWDTQSAIEMLTRVTTIDPAFADAWARLAQACIQMGVVFDSDPRWFQQAEDAVSRTLALDIGNADAFCARGQILWSPHHVYQNRAALRALNAALKLNPGCHAALNWRGAILFHLGLYAEARACLEESLAAHPGDTRAMVFLGQTALYRGDYEEAYEFNGRALAIDPASAWSTIFYPTIPLYLGRPAEAAEKLRVARGMVPGEPTLISIEGMIAAHEGDFAKAERLADEALTHTQTLLHTHHLWHNSAAVFAMCGKPEKAVPLLRRCAEMGLPNYLLFGSDPHLASLRQDADFINLMSGLRQEHERYAAEFGFTQGS